MSPVLPEPTQLTLLLSIDESQGPSVIQIADETDGVEGEAVAVERDDPPNPVLPEANEILWSAVFFFLLWLLMKFVLLPPIRRAQKNRANRLQDDRDSVDSFGEEQGRLVEEYEEALLAARSEASELLDGARERAENYRRDIISQTETELQATQDENSKELEAARAKALGDMSQEVRSLAADAAKAILGKAPDQSLVDANADRLENE